MVFPKADTSFVRWDHVKERRGAAFEGNICNYATYIDPLLSPHYQCSLQKFPFSDFSKPFPYSPVNLPPTLSGLLWFRFLSFLSSANLHPL
jgi:hypothetical protein